MWDAIFYSLLQHGDLTPFKAEFMLREPFEWIHLSQSVHQSVAQTMQDHSYLASEPEL